MKIGDKVKILDGSDMHGEVGIIYDIKDYVLVEVDCRDVISDYNSYIWPVSLDEIESLGK